jgi:hypothetical protein
MSNRSTGSKRRKDLGETMARNLAFGGAARPLGRNASSVACLAFVALLGIAFWAGALWIGEFIFGLISSAY